jgi:hypothetical protein
MCESRKAWPDDPHQYGGDGPTMTEWYEKPVLITLV